MARRRRHESRIRRLREGDERRGGGPDAGATMQLAVFAALVLVALAVATGFSSDATARRLQAALARLGPLAEPVWLGASPIEIGVLAIGALAIALFLWRWLR